MYYTWFAVNHIFSFGLPKNNSDICSNVYEQQANLCVVRAHGFPDIKKIVETKYHIFSIIIQT